MGIAPCVFSTIIYTTLHRGIPSRGIKEDTEVGGERGNSTKFEYTF